MAESEPGICRVVCFSPKHNLTIANMEPADLRKVVDTWVEQYGELGARAEINYVQIFENRGAMMGASNPHPHCQIWSSHAIPNEVAKEQAAQRAWSTACLLCDYARLECAAGERVVEENDAFVTVVPFWAVWPFETMVIAKRHVTAMDELDAAERDALAGHSEAHHGALRSPVRRLVSLLDGIPSAAHRWRSPRGMAFPRALLPSAIALGNGAQISGGVRNARHAAAGHHAGIGGGAVARSVKASTENFGNRQFAAAERGKRDGLGGKKTQAGAIAMDHRRRAGPDVYDPEFHSAVGQAE